MAARADVSGGCGSAEQGGAPEGAAGGRGGAGPREPRRPLLAVSDRLPVLWRVVYARPRERGRPAQGPVRLVVQLPRNLSLSLRLCICVYIYISIYRDIYTHQLSTGVQFSQPYQEEYAA
ncbi:uncharacterized protein FN964_016274 [Alca torda]